MKINLFVAMLCIATNIAAQTADIDSTQGYTSYDEYEVSIPPKPDPWRYVNDYSNLLTEQEKDALEWKLYSFADTTSIQIVVVTMPRLGNNPASLFATELGQSWGVGQAETDNGVVLLVKPKLDEYDYGEAHIATGYGAETVLTDLRCERIYNDIMLPYFRNNDYASGIAAGCDAIIGIMSGHVPELIAQMEYDDEALDRQIKFGSIATLIVYFVIMYLITLRRGKKEGRKIWPWIIGATLLTALIYFGKIMKFTLMAMARGGGGRSGRGSSGGYGGHSSGGGSFGGGGGGGRW